MSSDSTQQDIAGLAMLLDHVVVELDLATPRDRLAAMLRECILVLEMCMAARRTEDRISPSRPTNGELASLVARLFETDDRREQVAVLRAIRRWLAHLDQS